MPNITGQFKAFCGTASDDPNGVFKKILQYNGVASGGTGHRELTILFDTSSIGSIYGNSDTVQPPSVTALFLIKY